MAWTWPSIAVDNSPKCGFIALMSTPRLPPPTSESPCSASDSNIGVGNFWGAWPWPAQPSSFHHSCSKWKGMFQQCRLALRRGRESEWLQLIASSHNNLHLIRLSDHYQFDWTTAGKCNHHCLSLKISLLVPSSISSTILLWIFSWKFFIFQ